MSIAAVSARRRTADRKATLTAPTRRGIIPSAVGDKDPRANIDLSFVIPVYNGSKHIQGVVEKIHECYADLAFEVLLVDDGSEDETEKVCLALQLAHPATVTLIRLARNFGEHNAVLAGLNHAAGACVATLDDDGQNPPDQVRRMYERLLANECDVIYGRYRVKHHSRLRNLGSWFNQRMATLMLGKPPALYLSSFKVMNRFLVDEITKYQGAFPYIDGLILRATNAIGQIDVEHRPREGSRSTYNLRRLFLLWLNMFLNFSIMPLRLSALVGLLMSLVSLVLFAGIVLDKLYINPEVALGIPTIMVLVVLFAGVQLMILGVIGEYLGRLFLDHSKQPQFVVRYKRLREGNRE